MKTNFRSYDSLHGMVQTIRSYNPENGFAIAYFLADDISSPIPISGYLPGIREGELLEVQGVWMKHSQNGWHLEVKRFSIPPPTNDADLEQSLNLIQGISPEIAERIVQHWSLDTLRILEQSPSSLKQIEGITARRVQQIRDSWAQEKCLNQLRVLLQRPGMNRTLAMQLLKAFSSPSHSAKKLERLVSELYAIDWDTADSIAQVIGVKTNLPARVEAGVRQVMKQFMTEGHVLAKHADLVRDSVERVGVTKRLVENAIRRVAKTRALIVEADRIYLPPFYDAEVNVATVLRQIQATRKTRLAEFQEMDWTKSFNWLAIASQIVLTRQQQEAVKTALTNKVSILTGGPGTGKTTTVRAIVALLEKKGYTFQLAAPTGRAAKRLSQASGVPAQTLHRLLAFKPVQKKKGKHKAPSSDQEFARSLEQSLAADFIIVDECSMIDLFLMNDLVQSLDPTSHILFVGDPNQLPSIGAGKILQDMLESHAFPAIELDVIFRQKKDSFIITNAHRIRNGQAPFISNESSDFLFLGEQQPKRVAARVVELVTTLLPINYGYDSLEDIQVLCPMHDGPAGIRELNTALQAALNPPHSNKREWRHQDRILRVGDKVLQTRNNYTKGVFNGDSGRIVWMDIQEQCLIVEFEEQRVEYSFRELDELVHAFALTIHKAQGSEYRAVIVVLLPQHRKLLQRNLLYTALTRGKELAVLVGTQTAIAACVKNNKIAERHSHLTARLKPPQPKQKAASRPKPPQPKQKTTSRLKLSQRKKSAVARSTPRRRKRRTR